MVVLLHNLLLLLLILRLLLLVAGKGHATLVPLNELAFLLLSYEVFAKRAFKQVIDLSLVSHLGLPLATPLLVCFFLEFLLLEL